ncbi:uncharacterized protein ARMOST_14958 [Armillaria ostoyae]|uniref:Uncharacterized protein n=1 Tax=Armillaria ostoyae TaxID=47428 RepID=A0A284RS08_ARMOS|nr:uncharacterized protein ARMOST_14958 [Armillaria ostoyae]
MKHYKTKYAQQAYAPRHHILPSAESKLQDWTYWAMSMKHHFVGDRVLRTHNSENTSDIGGSARPFPHPPSGNRALDLLDFYTG